MSATWTARRVVDELRAAAIETELARIRRRLPDDVPALGVRMRDVFDVAKRAAAAHGTELDRLVDEPTYEARMAAVSVLDFRARRRIGDPDLCATYLRWLPRLTTWDIVDRAAPRVVGAAVAGGPYDVLDELAASAGPIARRTAITAPLWFARYGTRDDVTAGFAVAATLHADPDPSVSNAVGIFAAHAGEREPDLLRAFLTRHEAAMPRAAARLARRKLAGG